MREQKDEIGKVTFDFQMKTVEMQLKLEPTTPPEVREQRVATIKESMGILDATVTSYEETKVVELVSIKNSQRNVSTERKKGFKRTMEFTQWG